MGRATADHQARPHSPAEPRRAQGRGSWLIIALVLLVAAAVRLHGIGYGLPALYDPDEANFILLGAHLLSEGTLNPGWFGHPGTTTIYAMALIEAGVFLSGLATGQWSDLEAFKIAFFADPSIVFLPGRLFVAACGVGCVALTFMLGRRLFDDRIALIGAALLAVNPLHIEFSQIIRTDVQASLFMLMGLLAAVGIAREGRFAHYLRFALCVGLATATKWPAATMLLAGLGGAMLHARAHPGQWQRQGRFLVAMLVLSIAALIAVSPYLLLDFSTLMSNLRGEAQPHHLGATGGTLGENILWYLAVPVRQSLGWAGLAVMAVGIAVIARGHRSAAWLLIPLFALFLTLISTQNLIWSRWIVPMLPLVSLFVAVGIVWLADRISGLMQPRLRPALSRPLVGGALLLALAVPMALNAQAESRERSNDTRARASAWAKAHIPPGSRVVVEHLAFDLLDQQWTFLVPAGNPGCIDAGAEMRGAPSHGKISQGRQGKDVVDIGTVNPAMLATCHGTFAILSHLERYQAESGFFGEELQNYATLLNGAERVARFAPIAGESGGPVVDIYRLRPLATPPTAGRL